jgi:hypothetical protein
MSASRRAILIFRFNERGQPLIASRSAPATHRRAHHGYDAVNSQAAIELVTRWFPRINSVQ